MRLRSNFPRLLHLLRPTNGAMAFVYMQKRNISGRIIDENGLTAGEARTQKSVVIY